MFNLIKKAAASTHTIQQESSTVLEDFSEEFEKQLTKAKEAERNHPPEDERKRLEEEEQAEDKRIDHYIYSDQWLQGPNAGHGPGIIPHLIEPQGAHHRVHQTHGHQEGTKHDQGKTKGLRAHGRPPLQDFKR